MTEYPRPVVLRVSHGDLSAGTRVHVVDVEGEIAYVTWKDREFEVFTDDLVMLRPRVTPDLKKERQAKVERLLGP